MDITILISIFIFILVAKAKDRIGLGIYSAAILSVVIPFLISFLLSWINVSIVGKDLYSIVTVSVFIVLVCQLVGALIVFKRLEAYDDSIVGWLIWLLVGSVVIFAVIPPLISRFI